MEEKMVKIRKKLKVAQEKQKSYANKNRTYREFKVGEHVFLKVKVKRISLRLGVFPNLTAKYCGSFEFLEKIGLVAYMLTLHGSMIIHNLFQVSLLKKYVLDPNHMTDWIVI
jgi:hypothetical protein